ncbi:class I SAM-dependent methyltransferase [Candidatus Woesearchaeota archaeon]|nr:class I SAM-dependent methyltransferase [Candidatus Woesearchaeota archaeon]
MNITKNHLNRMTTVLLWIGALFYFFEFLLHLLALPILEHDKIFLYTHDRYIALFALTYSVLLFLISTDKRKYNTLFLFVVIGILFSFLNGFYISSAGGYAPLFNVSAVDSQLQILGYFFLAWYFLLLISWYGGGIKRKKKNLLQTTKKDTFIPAARFHVLTPLFDALCNAVGLGGKYRNRIVAKLDIQGKMQVLDAGCGSGSLALDVKKRYAKAALYAVDADPTILAIAEQKAKEAKQQIHFRKAFLQKLPFPDNSFDVVYSSLVFHHLSSNIKKEAMKEIHRVLKKDGRFLLIDFGRPKHILFAIFSWFTVIFEEGYDNYKGRIPIMVTDSGFSKVTEVEKYKFNIASLEAVK